MKIGLLFEVNSLFLSSKIFNILEKLNYPKICWKIFRFRKLDYMQSMTRMIDCFGLTDIQTVDVHKSIFISVVLDINGDLESFDRERFLNELKKSIFFEKAEEIKLNIYCTCSDDQVRLFCALLKFSYKDNIALPSDLTKAEILLLPGQPEWSSLEEMVAFVNVACDWVILRNFEYLLDGTFWVNDNDIDALSSRVELLRAAMNAVARKGGRSSYETRVEGKKLLLDLRYIGDKYYDPMWARDMLINKKDIQNIPVLSDGDYFFSLIYHSFLQKEFINPIYVGRINFLARSLKYDICTSDGNIDEVKAFSFLNRFLDLKNYTYTHTNDCYVNYRNIKRIYRHEINDRRSDPKLYLKWFVLELKSALKHYLRKIIR